MQKFVYDRAKHESETAIRNYLNARLAEVDAQSVGVFRVMLDELLQRSEGGAACDEEAALVQLAYPVVLDCVTISHRQGVVVVSALGVTNQESAVLVLGQQQLLFRLYPLDLAEVPRLRFDGLQLGNIVRWNVAFLACLFAPRQPPIALKRNKRYRIGNGQVLQCANGATRKCK